MVRSPFVASFSLICLLGACAPAEQPEQEAPTTEADVEAITSVRQQEGAAIEAGDVEALVALVTDDAVLMAPGEPAATGRAAFRSWAEGLLEQGDVEIRDYTSDAVEVFGDWAYERYSGTIILAPTAAGDTLSETYQGIHILQRQPDGSWKIVLDIWNAAGGE